MKATHRELPDRPSAHCFRALSAFALAAVAALLFLLVVWVLDEHRSPALVLALEDPWQPLLEHRPRP